MNGRDDSFQFRLLPQLPPLAWVARCVKARPQVIVFHGARVEVGSDWFFEGIWDEPYEEGRFDRTDLVYGSGARLTSTGVTFVGSGTTVDRLQSLEDGMGVWVSNSLPLLMTVADARLDVSYRGYYKDFLSIVEGLSRYRRRLRTSAGGIELTYFHNLKWDGKSLTVAEKPSSDLVLEDFRSYEESLAGALGRLARNMASPARNHPYGMLGTLSSGYDSPTVAALVRDHGLEEVITFPTARGGSDDSGHLIAERLDLEVETVPRDGWSTGELAETYFVAADAKGEDLYFYAARESLRGKVLLTGFHGDKVWERDVHDKYLGTELVRGDQSGLSLSEFRLHFGFVNCPVPFMGARQIAAINGISRSEEMRPWSVGGRYDRPICRRIVETAGVPRDSFGVTKRAASVLLARGRRPLDPASAEDLDRYLAERLPVGGTRRPWISRASDVMAPVARSLALGAGHGLQGVARLAPGPLRLVRSAGTRLVNMGNRNPHFDYLFPWAVERVQLRYQQAGSLISEQLGKDLSE